MKMIGNWKEVWTLNSLLMIQFCSFQLCTVDKKGIVGVLEVVYKEVHEFISIQVYKDISTIFY